MIIQPEVWMGVRFSLIGSSAIASEFKHPDIYKYHAGRKFEANGRKTKRIVL